VWGRRSRIITGVLLGIGIFILALLNILSIEDVPSDVSLVPAILVAGLACFALTISGLSPILSGILAVIADILINVTPGKSIYIASITTSIIPIIIIWSGHRLLGCIFAILYISIEIYTLKTVIIDDSVVIQNSIINTAFLTLFLLLGELLLRQSLANDSLEARRQAELAEQRRAIARELHDTAVYSTTMLVVPVGAAIGYFSLMLRSPKVTRRERTHLRAYIPLWVGAVLFFMISEQAAGKMATFAKDNTDGRIPLLGWVITPEAYQSVNPAAIVLLAPLVGWFFTRRAGRFPSTIVKFAISVFVIGLSAFLMGYGFRVWPGGQDLSPWWFLAAVFVIQTVSELFLSPVGLSTTTALAPKSFASQAMSMWQLSIATGQGLAGFIIAQTEDIPDSTYYYGLGAVTVAAALILFAVAPWTQRQMADVEAAGAHDGEGD